MAGLTGSRFPCVIRNRDQELLQEWKLARYFRPLSLLLTLSGHKDFVYRYWIRFLNSVIYISDKLNTLSSVYNYQPEKISRAA